VENDGSMDFSYLFKGGRKNGGMTGGEREEVDTSVHSWQGSH